MFESIFARFQKRYIKLNIDPLLHSSLPIKYRSAQTRFKLNLFNFVLAIGLSRSVRTTNKIKFADAADFVERFVKNDNDELIVSINDVDVDDKIKIAEHIGEGLSIIIAEQLYDIQRSNISKIKRKKNESKPDYEGYSRNLKIVWEAKGSTNTINQRIIRHAKNQKKRVPANIAFASFANLIPHCITEVTIEDPPTFLPGEGNLQRLLAKVRHYVNLFNFIGQAELSKYFEYVGKRLEKDTDFPEFDEKQKLYDKIKKDYVRIEINTKSFLGNIEQVEDSKFLYVGFDEDLLTVSDFISFRDYENDYTYRKNKNVFRISKDGICIGYLSNLDFVKEQVKNYKIPFYKENLSIADIDNMFEFQLIDQMLYFLKKEGFTIERESLKERKRYDTFVKKGKERFILEVKKGDILKSFDQIKEYKKYLNVNKVFFITNKKLSKEDINHAKSQDIVIIDRERLNQIIRNKKSISSFIN